MEKFQLSWPKLSTVGASQLALLLAVWLLWLTGCAQATPEAAAGAVYREETAVLPTAAPTRKPTPTSTRVIPATVLTPGPSPTITPIPDQVRGLVVDVIDGNTITVVLEGDPAAQTYPIRYLGIDAPPNAPSVPWGIVAFETNRKLAEGKIVRLERDQSDTDDEGNLLRYAFLGDELLSVILAQQGLARANITEPDTRFRNEILEAEKQAREKKLGLWGPLPTPTSKLTIATTATLTTTATVSATVVETPEPEATAEDTATPNPSAAPATTEATIAPTRTATPTPSAEATAEELQGPP